ncbi:hypothetical protein J5N97_018227 [Dioscorea zingiberensis]|uniref:Uncharacterized protein n=1 Tax=Dioscorea zingiberensis TaxID=325984 RepID=A0A9D5HHF5_9LILI|nr:hypothetical protein J5N97_018227 [Dioscorea zingiberensis]
MFSLQSLEAYYQEAGRAGRDGKLSDCTLYVNLSRIPTLLPSQRSEEQTKQAYRMLSDCFRYGMNTSPCRARTLVKYFGARLYQVPKANTTGIEISSFWGNLGCLSGSRHAILSMEKEKPYSSFSDWGQVGLILRFVAKDSKEQILVLKKERGSLTGALTYHVQHEQQKQLGFLIISLGRF